MTRHQNLHALMILFLNALPLLASGIITCFVFTIFFSCSCVHKNTIPQVVFDSVPGLVFIQGGEFLMGDLTGDGMPSEKPVHQVQLSGFYLSDHEVTVGEFRKFITATAYITDAEKKDSSLAYFNGRWIKMKGVDWQYNANGRLRPDTENEHPVVHVSWNDANAYCAWLSKKWNCNFHLPTEAQWEYAARGGPTGSAVRYSGSSMVEEVAWYRANSGDETHPVGLKKPNRLGLYDMTGNVWEWCSDWFDKDYYTQSPLVDPCGPEIGTVRSFRGGCWYSDEDYLRLGFHQFGNYPDQSYGDFGFRIALTP